MEQILSQAQIDEAIKKLDLTWAAIGNDFLVRVFETGTFKRGVELVNRIAEVAEAHNHHPEVSLRFDQVELKVNTHSIQGITDKDFAFAEAVDKLDI